MRSIKNRVAALERSVGTDSVQTDSQYGYLLAERLELALAWSEAIQTGRKSEAQELNKKLSDNTKALQPYGKYPFRFVSVESHAEALQRALDETMRADKPR